MALQDAHIDAFRRHDELLAQDPPPVTLNALQRARHLNWHPALALKTFIVEDNKVIYDNLVLTLQELANIEVVGHASDEYEAQLWLERGGLCELMIIDVFLKAGSGLGVLAAAQASDHVSRRVVLTNYATPDIRKRCALLGADRVFDKSHEIDDLIAYCAEIEGI